MAANALARADALLHPAAHLPRIVVFPALEPHRRDGLPGGIVSGWLVQPPHLQAVHHVVDDIAVRKKAVVLENHGDPAAPKLHQLPGRVCTDVHAVEVDPSRSGFREPDEAAHQSRLAAAGKAPWTTKDLSRVYGERDVSKPDHDPQLPAYLFAGHHRVFLLQRGLGIISEHLPDVVDLYEGFTLTHVGHLPLETQLQSGCQQGAKYSGFPLELRPVQTLVPVAIVVRGIRGRNQLANLVSGTDCRTAGHTTQ